MEKERKQERRSWKEEDIIRTKEWEGEKEEMAVSGWDWQGTSMMLGKKYTGWERERRHRNKGWKRTWQGREADRDNMWQWNREIMADRFNEVFPDVILNCNYSVLLSAWVYMHVCAAPNIPPWTSVKQTVSPGTKTPRQHMTKAGARTPLQQGTLC